MASVPAVAAVPPPARNKLIKSETGIVPMNDAKLYGQTGEATGKNDPVPDLMSRDPPLPPSRLVIPRHSILTPGNLSPPGDQAQPVRPRLYGVFLQLRQLRWDILLRWVLRLTD